MSNESDSDPELMALRNELLTGLKKINEENKNEKIEEDDELERLRFEALNAKRIKSSDEKKKNEKPGRFRYDRDSNDEEDEEELELRASFTPNDDSEESGQENELNQNIDLKANNYHFNYQKYRVECSKLMSNDAYEPDSSNDTDLRNFLRDKANRNKNLNISSNENNLINPDDLDYVYEPITEPIAVQKNEIYMNKKYYDRNEKSYANGFNRYELNEEEYPTNVDLYESDDDDEEEEFHRNKKLKSIVVAKISSSRDQIESNRSSRYSSSSYYRRRRRYSSSNSR